MSCLPFLFCPLPQAGSAERRAVRSALCPGACQSWDTQPMACSWTHRSLHQALIQTSLPGGMPWGSALLCFESHSYLYQQSMQRVPQNEREGEEKEGGGQRVWDHNQRNKKRRIFWGLILSRASVFLERTPSPKAVRGTWAGAGRAKETL